MGFFQLAGIDRGRLCGECLAQFGLQQLVVRFRQLLVAGLDIEDLRRDIRRKYKDARDAVEDFADEARDQVLLAEKAGFDFAWFAEHHFSNFSLCPSPLMMVALAPAGPNVIDSFRSGGFRSESDNSLSGGCSIGSPGLGTT